jgi:hypothetical protein
MLAQTSAYQAVVVACRFAASLHPPAFRMIRKWAIRESVQTLSFMHAPLVGCKGALFRLTEKGAALGRYSRPRAQVAAPIKGRSLGPGPLSQIFSVSQSSLAQHSTPHSAPGRGCEWRNRELGAPEKLGQKAGLLMRRKSSEVPLSLKS